VDLSTSDLEAALVFYPELLGWAIRREESPLGRYYVGMVGGEDVAGMMAFGPGQPGSMPPAWTVYIRVEHLESTMALAYQAGGKAIAPAVEISGGGRRALMADPTGAAFGLLEHPAGRGVGMWGETGAVCWCEVMTRDPAADMLFYEDVFGWKGETETMGGTPYTTFKKDGLDIAGLLPMPKMVPYQAPSHWMVYFSVPDCEVAVRKGEGLGGKVLLAPTDVAVGTFSVLADPQGGVFSVFTPEP
jgi:hypothetical protein